MEAAENVLLQAGDLPNQAHIGIGLGLLGASLIHQDMRNEGLGCLTVSLETLEGLGWLRTEAEIALQRLTICQEKEKTTPGQICEGTIADAERLVYRLRSDDLLTQLESLRKDSSPG
jgi:hypothetical protein